MLAKHAAMSELSRRQKRRLAEEIHGRGKMVRGWLMNFFQGPHRKTGVAEVDCPCCERNGWLDVEDLVPCPLCYGTGTISATMQRYWRVNRRRFLKGKSFTMCSNTSFGRKG